MIAGRRIGLDFDNTIVLYDRVFCALGVRAGLLPSGFRGSKDAVRAAIRALPDGEAKWTALQADVYGPGIVDAEMAPGLVDFLAASRRHDCDVVIVSHKTEYAAAAPNGTNLRQAARDWLHGQGLTVAHGGVIADAQIFFADTREAKIGQIVHLNCHSFVDDLEEVFLEPSFPASIERHLMKIGATDLPSGPFTAWRSFADLQKAWFGDR
jgi:hypothetical protein